MLKLTNSFYRYFTVTCERVDYKSHLKKYSQLTCVRERCISDYTDLQSKRQFHCNQVVKKHCEAKKRPRVKISSLNSDELDRSAQMSESVQPTGNHVSCGGNFEVSSDKSSENMKRYSREGERRANAAKQSGIPSNFRNWESIVSSSSDESTFKFKVISYNVLAQCLLESHPYLYARCSSRDLSWNVRSERLFNEISSLAPDILCLQEVEARHMNTFYSRFDELGYRGIFKQKTGARHDGCAIYFKTSRFEMVDNISVEFYQPAVPILNRDNVALMLKLVPRCTPHSPIVVSTTHLLYNPKRMDVRLAQMQVLIAELDRFSYYDNGTECGHMPIILTGDFNSMPNSEVVQLLDAGHASFPVDVEHPQDPSDWRLIGITDSCQHLSVNLNRELRLPPVNDIVKLYHTERPITREWNIQAELHYSSRFNSRKLTQSLNLVSVYHQYKSDGKYAVSTYQDFWTTVDYIYYSRNRYLRLTDRLRLPWAHECLVLKRLPNQVYASDHLALGAIFEIHHPRQTAE